MTLRKAESITGYEIVRLDLDFSNSIQKDLPHRVYFEAREDGEMVAVAGGKTEKEALAKLVENVYKIHSEIVRRRQNFRCCDCGEIRPLETDHVKPRSKGRDDRLSNLVARCVSAPGRLGCHAKKHGLKDKSKEYRERGQAMV